MEIQFVTDYFIMSLVAPADVRDLHQLRTNPEVCKFFYRDLNKTEQDTALFVEDRVKDAMLKASFYFTIRSAGNLDLMGTACLWRIDYHNQYAEVGYELLPHYQGKGIMSKALQQVLQFGFEDLNLNTIEAYTHRENTHSIKLLKRNYFELVAGKKDPDEENNIVYQLNAATFSSPAKSV